MARKSTGSVVVKATSRGESFALRFRAYGKRHFVHLGYAPEWTRERAEEELAFVLASARRGEWEPHREPEPPREVPTFHVFASRWLAEREGELRPATVAAYHWALVDHLLPHFHRMPIDRIGVEEVDAYRRLKVGERRLSAASVNQTIGRLGQVLDAAEERGLIARNPVRVNPRNRKLKAGKPKRAWLEPWQVLALLDGAGELDREDRRGLPVRRPLLAALAWAGLRISEAAALHWRDVDLAAGRIRVRQSKTHARLRGGDPQP